MEKNEKIKEDKKLKDIKDSISNWKKILRRVKGKKIIERIEKLSDSDINFDKITNIIDNLDMWKKFDGIIKKK